MWACAMQGPEYLEVDATVSCVDGSEADEVNPPGQYLLIIDCKLKLNSPEKLCHCIFVVYCRQVYCKYCPF